MKKIVLSAAFILFAFNCCAQTLQDTLAQIDKIFSVYQPQNPGCELAISRNGVVIYSKAWGMADLEHMVPLTTTSITEGGSVSKQFTAAAILLLAQQNKLSLDDDIRKYLPEMPDYGSVIKIKHLLHHTSGLRDWGSVMDVAGWPRWTKAYSNDDALNIVTHQKALNNKPGDEYIYSNSNFNLLAMIVKRVTGTELAEFTRKYIFEPAGMTHTQWRDDYKRVVLNRAIAYDKLEKGYQADMPIEYAYGNGGLLTTAEDLLKWNEFYWNGKLGSPSLLQQQIAVDHFNNGLVNPYAAGLFIAKRRGWDYINHSGSTAGYRAYLLRYPQLNFSIAFLSNDAELDIGMIRKVEDLFVPNKETDMRKTANSIAPYAIPADKLKGFTGWYRNEKTGAGTELMVKDDTLRSRRFKLKPTGPDAFMAGNQKVVFNTGGFLIIAPAGDSTIFKTAKAGGTGDDYLKTYTGQYYSSETESKFTVIVKDGKLTLHIEPVKDFKLSPTYYDAFDVADGLGNVYFTRDASGKISGFNISVDRARNIVFLKM